MMLLRSDIILLLLTLGHANGKLPPSGTLSASNRTVPHNSVRRGDARKHRGLQSGTCGGGSVGDGICPNGMCCSSWGWCGTTPEHCDNKSCGGGQVGNGICVDGSCCSQWGSCGTSPEYCQTEPPNGTPMPTSPPASSEVPASLPPSASPRPGDLPDNPSVPNRLVVYATSWAQYRVPGAATLPDGSTVSRPDSCAARATKPAAALASGATHINYAFAVLDPTSYAVITYEWNDADLMTSLNAGKGEVKTLISIGGWSFSQGETPTYGESSKIVFPTMAATQASRAAFISSAIAFASQYNFDGIDLDWEYPEEADRENFIALLAEMRAAIDEDGRGLLFTAALPAGISSFQKIALDRVASYLDFVNLMSYDFHGGSFEPEGPVFSQTPILDCSGLFKEGWDIQTAVTEYLNAGVPAEKLTLGLAAYGRTWTLAGSNADLGAPANGAGPAGSCTLEPGSLAYYEIMESIDVSGISYDKHTLSAFARYGDNGFVAFDDPQTISDKVCWARSLGLGGLMIWDADQDDSHTISKGVAASMGADFSQSCGGFTMPSCS